MIDIHSHILPGLDDGSETMEETLGIVRQLHKTGFKTLIATPHVIEGRDFLNPSEILETTERVRERVAEAKIPVEILPGAENYIFPDLAKWVQAGKLLTLGNAGKYILVEFPMLEIPNYTDQVFFELQVLGITPILAHPERNKGLAEEPERILEWAKKGILFQLNLRSLSGHYGPLAKQLAEILLRNNLIHVIGSDSHRVSRSGSTYSEGLRNIKEIVGGERYLELTQKNPQMIVRGEALPSEREYTLTETVKKKTNRFWGMFRK